MSELPSNWVVSPIGDLISLNPKIECPDELPAGFVPMQMLGKEYSSPVRFETRPWGEIKKGYTHFANGDVLLAKITPCFENGKAGLVRELPNGVGAGSTEYFVSRPHLDMLNSRYLYAFLKTDKFLKAGAVQMTGSVGHKRVPKDYLLETELPLAPINEQKRIADKLDAVLARVDACRDRLDRIPAILKRFRQTVLAAATSGKLTEDWRASQVARMVPQAESGNIARDSAQSHYVVTAAPDSATLHPGYEAESTNGNEWRQVQLSEVARDLSYGTSAKSSKSGAVPVLRMGNIQDGRLDWNSLAYTSDLKEIAKYRLASGDVLFNRTNSPELVGKTAVFKGEREAIYAGYLIRVRCLQQLLPDYFNYCLGSPAGRDYCWQVKSDGVSQSNINAKKLAAFNFLLPTVEEQTEIVRRVEALFAFADRLEARHTAARAQVEKLTPATLAKAFRGELVSQDPNDEPASELLERIRTERDEQPETKPKRRKAEA